MSLGTVPKLNGVEEDTAMVTSLEGESRAVLVLGVEGGDFFVRVGLALAVDFQADGTLLILDHQINPFAGLHAGFGFGVVRAAGQFDAVTTTFEHVDADHVVADLEDGATTFEFGQFELVAHAADELIRNAIDVGYGLQTQMVVALELLHRLFLGLELGRDNEMAVLDLLAGLATPTLGIVFTIEGVGVDQLALFEELGFEDRGFDLIVGLHRMSEQDQIKAERRE